LTKVSTGSPRVRHLEQLQGLRLDPLGRVEHHDGGVGGGEDPVGAGRGPPGPAIRPTLPGVGGDHDLLERLRAGDERAFVALVDRYQTSMVRLAAAYVPSQAVAEEVVQDTWMAVVRGLGRFEERSSLKTWLFRILVNRARTTGVRERRTTPLGADEPTVDPRRFGPDGHWVAPPAPWTEEVEDRVAAAETVGRIRAAIDELPPGPRQVVLLRDVEGLTGAEVGDILGVSDGNQRVLLHRGRARVRRMFERQAREV
jgi:RNA polymerase sigma-70 factor, ECF subfamily